MTYNEMVDIADVFANNSILGGSVTLPLREYERLIVRNGLLTQLQAGLKSMVSRDEKTGEAKVDTSKLAEWLKEYYEDYLVD